MIPIINMNRGRFNQQSLGVPLNNTVKEVSLKPSLVLSCPARNESATKGIFAAMSAKTSIGLDQVRTSTMSGTAQRVARLPESWNDADNGANSLEFLWLELEALAANF